MTAEPQSAAHLNQETLFRKAMSSFPTGVTIVTTRDADGRRRGFTATAFCHVSTQPRLVLVCLSANAECHPAFVAGDRWNVHVIPAEHAGLARRFATRGADKFADAEFELDSHGIPRLDRACITLSCSMHQVYPAGDHTILIGHVEHTELHTSHPVVYYQHDFHELPIAQ